MKKPMNLLVIIRLYIGQINCVNDISVIANNPNVCEINSGLEIGLSGQVVADSV